MKNFIILRTDKGGRYARKIRRSIEWINNNSTRFSGGEEFDTSDMTISEFMQISYVQSGGGAILTGFLPRDTVVHARCANPRTDWTIRLRKMEERGYTVVNSVDALELTSNKLACALRLQSVVQHPQTWEFNRNWDTSHKERFVDAIWNWADTDHHYIIAKPLTSLSQGAHVQKVSLDTSRENVLNAIQQAPGDKIVVQEFFPYTAMHRVIVIGGHALPYTFVDKVEWHPQNWKVSCCLNRTTMRIETEPDIRLLEIAERTQRAVNGEINFIDIFENDDWRPLSQERFSISEINTACSLNIHEQLAQEAGRKDWNIHYRIAKHLVRKAMGE